MGACTAAAIEVRYHDDNDVIKGAVEFLDSDDWRTELRDAFDLFKDDTGNARPNEFSLNLEGKTALSKVSC